MKHIYRNGSSILANEAEVFKAIAKRGTITCDEAGVSFSVGSRYGRGLVIQVVHGGITEFFKPVLWRGEAIVPDMDHICDKYIG